MKKVLFLILFCLAACSTSKATETYLITFTSPGGKVTKYYQATLLRSDKNWVEIKTQNQGVIKIFVGGGSLQIEPLPHNPH